MQPPIHLLCESRPLLQKQEREATPNSCWSGRCWECLSGAWRASRRYSIVATEVSLLALNVVFFACKADDEIPAPVGQTTLALLGTVGILSLHYSLDLIWKRIQDTRFACNVKNHPLTALSALNALQQSSSALLLTGSFVAGIAGAAGDANLQTTLYRDMTLWGEISLGTGLALTLSSLYVTRSALKALETPDAAADERLVATLRFCMDKDTLWHLIAKLEDIPSDDEERLDQAMSILKKNIETQYKVTLGGRLALIVVGDLLQGIEKVYTPDSLVSASINLGVSVAYAVWIASEKYMEYRQRETLDESLLPSPAEI